MGFSPLLGCSTITFRKQPLAGALSTIRHLGFSEIDLGALPGVCDHVPYRLDDDAVSAVGGTVVDSGLSVRSINADIGDLNKALTPTERLDRDAHLARLLDLVVHSGASALVLPCGALSRDPVLSLDADLDRVAEELRAASRKAADRGVQLWVESLHFFRLCWNAEMAAGLQGRLDGSDVGVVMDVSHLVASGADPVRFIERHGHLIRHVHLRDALPGNINLSLGKGEADFGSCFQALHSAGYDGHFSLELETHDVTDGERPRAAAMAGRLITELLQVHSLSGEKV
jgi:sugar phosphate isomerase/epimerase